MRYVCLPASLDEIVVDWLWFVGMHSDVLRVDPVRHEVLHWCSLPLGSHVAHTSDGCEVKSTLVGLDVALHFGSVHPWGPWLNNVPVKLLDPSPGSQGGYGTIGVA